MNEPDYSRVEDCRWEILAVLYSGTVRQLREKTIIRRLSAEFKFTEIEIANSLAFLVSAGLVSWQFDRLGSTKSYWINADGMLVYERKQILPKPSENE